MRHAVGPAPASIDTLPTRSRLVPCAILLAALVAVACEGGTTDPDPDVEVLLTPDTMTVVVGQTRQLTATVRNVPAGEDAGVDFASSATAIATVDQAGVVRGVAPGTATIAATARADASATATSTVTVTAPPAEVEITSVLDAATNQPVDPQAVADSIRVVLTAHLTAGVTARADVAIDAVVACSETVAGGDAALVNTDAAPSGAQLQVVCPINTAQLDDVSGTPKFANGQHALSARLVAQNGSVLATSPSQQIVLNNRDRIDLVVTTTRGPVEHNGVTWRGGDVTVLAQPVIFSGAGSQVAQLNVQVTGTGVNAAASDANPADGLSVAFPADAPPPDGLGDVQTQVTIAAQTVLTGGAAGPTPAPVTMAVDNRPAVLGALRLPGNAWINGSFKFDETAFTAPPDDLGGVNQLRVSFFATDPTGGPTPVTRPQDMQQTTRNDVVLLSVRVVDALDNERTVQAPRAAGVDYTPVTLSVDALNPAIIRNGSVNSGSTFAVSATDEHSGVAQVRSAIEHITSSLNFCYVGNASGGGCAPVAGPTSFAAPTFDGYYRFTVNATDVAGNTTGDQVVVVSLRDGVNPVIGNPALPAGALGGPGFTVTTSVTDNLDLDVGTFIQCFNIGGQPECIARGEQSLGTFGADTLSASGTLTFPGVSTFIRSTTLTADGTDAPEGTPYAASRISVAAVDQAGNRAIRNIDLAPAQVQPPGPSFADTLDVFRMTSPGAGDDVGNGDAGGPACPAGVSTTVPISVDVTGSAGFANPFSFVTIYRVDGQGNPRFVADLTDATRIDGSGTTTYRFGGAFDATGLKAQVNAVLAAVGVTAAGDALKAQDVAIDILNCH